MTINRFLAIVFLFVAFVTLTLSANVTLNGGNWINYSMVGLISLLIGGVAVLFAFKEDMSASNVQDHIFLKDSVLKLENGNITREMIIGIDKGKVKSFSINPDSGSKAKEEARHKWRTRRS